MGSNCFTENCAVAQMGLHMRSDGSIDTNAFKIVYVAPMKALVAEMVGNFSKRLEKFGIQVLHLMPIHSSSIPSK